MEEVGKLLEAAAAAFRQHLDAEGLEKLQQAFAVAEKAGEVESMRRAGWLLLLYQGEKGTLAGMQSTLERMLTRHALYGGDNDRLDQLDKLTTWYRARGGDEPDPLLARAWMAWLAAYPPSGDGHRHERALGQFGEMIEQVADPAALATLAAPWRGDRAGELLLRAGLWSGRESLARLGIEKAAGTEDADLQQRVLILRLEAAHRFGWEDEWRTHAPGIEGNAWLESQLGAVLLERAGERARARDLIRELLERAPRRMRLLGGGDKLDLKLEQVRLTIDLGEHTEAVQGLAESMRAAGRRPLFLDRVERLYERL